MKKKITIPAMWVVGAEIEHRFECNIPNILTAIVVTAVSILLTELCFSEEAVSHYKFLPGSLLVSRNHDELSNDTPGYWNHVAVILNNHQAIESQQGSVDGKRGHGVLVSEIRSLLTRVPKTVILIAPRRSDAGASAAARAASFSGLPYRRFSSLAITEGEIRKNWGMNCVSVAEGAWECLEPRIQWCKTPDDLVRLAYCSSEFYPPVLIQR